MSKEAKSCPRCLGECGVDNPSPPLPPRETHVCPDCGAFCRTCASRPAPPPRPPRLTCVRCYGTGHDGPHTIDEREEFERVPSHLREAVPS